MESAKTTQGAGKIRFGLAIAACVFMVTGGGMIWGPGGILFSLGLWQCFILLIEK